MNYLWEVALRADQLGVPREKLRYTPARVSSPYMEAAFENLNQSLLEDPVVEANPLYRFSSIFSRLFDINTEGLEQTRQVFFDVVMQYLVQLDLRQGLCREEYYLRFLLKDFQDGVCGGRYAEAIRQFSGPELRPVLSCILRLCQCGSSVALFRRAMWAVYPNSLVYASNDTARELLIYIGHPETGCEQQKVDFLINVFLPLNFTTHLFWERHFGIVDVDVTMELDEMVLF